MVYTRIEAKLAFIHVLENVLGRCQGSVLWTALSQEGVDNIVSLCKLNEDKIDSLRYHDSPVKLAERMLLRCFLDYVAHRRRQGNPIGHGWSSISMEEFDQFRISPGYLSTLTSIKFSTNDEEFDLWGDILDEEESNDLVLEYDNDDDDLMDGHNDIEDKPELMSREIVGSTHNEEVISNI